jgi:hypothetical protein
MSIPTVAALHALLLASAASPDTTLAVGDLVASFDHPDDDVRYGPSERTSGVIGHILRINHFEEGCSRYDIEVDRFFRGDTVEPRVRTFYLSPPMNGTRKLAGGITFGVVRLPLIEYQAENLARLRAKFPIGSRVKWSQRVIGNKRDYWLNQGREPHKSNAKRFLDEAIAARGTVVLVRPGLTNGTVGVVSIFGESRHDSLDYLLEPATD